MHESESEGIESFLARQLFGVFEVEEWQVQGAAVRFRGNLLAQPETAVAILRQRLEPVGFLPLLPSTREILILPIPAGAKRGVAEKPWPQILLFVT
ncbi:MAG: hypothetical protein ACREIZ_04835, partial [Candidatus Methylomirabilales bacterium]